MSRFGASKFRNAIPHIPDRAEWYRSSLPPGGGGSGNLQTSTFSSEIKANHRHVVTLTVTGDVSWRGYDVSAETRSGKVGAVGDWDLSKVGSGEMVVGGTDGSITLFQLDSELSVVSQIASTRSSITAITLHPTTPSLALSSSSSHPLAIWDLTSNSSSPTISLDLSEPKGLWSVAWSTDGKKVGAIGKSGTAYIFDPRSSTSPIITRSLPLQPLKPARIALVGDDVFVTSFSRTRSREYHLFSPADLSTKFTATLDTSTSPLIPAIDQERRIVYIAAKGDMTLRQVELGGAMGYQETIHPLQSPLSAQGLALASPTILPVMQAQIATVLIPVTDKDGEVVLPLGIRVPRRHLIDYHAELFPDAAGFIPEQSAAEWLKGEDRAPLPISLDPSRRSIWEGKLASVSNNQRSTASNGSRQTEAVSSKKEDIAPTKSAEATPAAPSEGKEDTSRSERSPTTARRSEDDQEDTPDASRPAVQNKETYSSTEYKARLIAKHIEGVLKSHRADGQKAPLFVGLQGPQGCGKTTLCDGFVAYLKDNLGISAAVLSLDDLYHTNANLKALASKHPKNQLLSGRGPSGTHDVKLASSVLNSVTKINESQSPVHLPIFDKSLCGGEGDRSSSTIDITGPTDVFILEGWSMGFAPLTSDRLSSRYSSKSNEYFSKHSFDSLQEINDYLSDLSSAIYPLFSTFISVVPTSYEYVFTWRLQQEHAMKEKNGGKGMNDEQVRAFVERYMPGYELWREGMWHQGFGGLEIRYGREREVLGVKVIEGTKKALISSKGPTLTPTEPTKSGIVEQDKIALNTQPKAPEETRSASAEVTKPAPTAESPTPTSKQTTPFNPNYSRKFLAGKSPLNPTYDSVPLVSTLHPDSQLLKLSKHLMFFPIQGPGGRLAVHPLRKKGRMTTGGEGYLTCGSEIVDFAVDPFGDVDGNGGGARIAVAGEDGNVRMWSVPNEGVHGTGQEAEMVLKGEGIDKIAHLSFHPTAKDLLVALSNDAGAATLRFFDLSSQTEAKAVPLDVKGVFGFAFHSSGKQIAISTKDGRILIFDPRKPDSIIECKAHDSPRSFQLAWVDESTLVSIGFDRGSQRKINLYSIDSASRQLTKDNSVLIDVSPSVLFPVYDPDTRILYTWGKGERVISAYEIAPPNASAGVEKIAKLPSFTSGEAQLGIAFFAKLEVDVKKVEVIKGLRLTGRSVEEVSFNIPRNKPDFFQDDIYVDTLDTATPALTAAEWLAGKDGEARYLSLKPEAMTPVSQAPAPKVAKPKFVPAKDVMSEQEKKQKEMDALFAKAKMDESSDEEEPVKKGLDPPDDDW